MNSDAERANEHLTGADINNEVRSEEGRAYDLSFAYRFHWDRPEKQIKEALKVLLCNCATDKPDNQAQSVEKESKRAAEEEATRIRWLLAINPNTPPPVLEHLANEESLRLLERIAENPRTHSSTLAKLARHNNSQVRAAVAENTNLSIKIVWKLVRDENSDVRYRLAESYTVPIAVLRVLTEDDNPYVAHRAQFTIKRIMQEVAALRSA